jgi:uncharacterized membrane protein YjgN (DUF898 family)
MKNYFKFNLTGQKLLPVWLLYMFLFLIPYIYIQVRLQDFKQQPGLEHQEAIQRMFEMLGWLGIMLLLVIVRYAITFFIAKMSIENTEFKLKNIEFNGRFGEFMGIIILGFFLTIITLGIYSPWFIKKVYDFFAENSAHESNTFKFNGKGINLFVILTLFIVATIALTVAFTITLIGSFNHTSSPTGSIGLFLVILVLMIPYIYYVSKWSVDFTFKNYHISWETELWKSLGKIVLELLLSIITLGIYLPLASLKLYQYFAERTIAKSETNSKTFGYDLESGKDLLFIWGQILLSIITLGIYYSWAYCKITSRILSKTYSEDVVVAE